MYINFSSLTEDKCPLLQFIVTENSSIYNQTVFAFCVVTAVLAPLTVAANAFILAAIWKNPSLKTPCHVLLAGLAVTDFCTGLITQPSYAVLRFAVITTGDGKKFCDAKLVADGFGYFFSSLTVLVMTLMAVERWLHMSRRSLLTVRRVVITFISFTGLLFLLEVAGSIFVTFYGHKASKVLLIFGCSMGAFCVLVTAFAYFKVFRIIRQHQIQVHAHGNTIEIRKYKKSIFTILYILAVFVIGYFPVFGLQLVLNALQYYKFSAFPIAADSCIVLIFFSSCVNPLLYYWRIKEIRDAVKSILRKLLCKQNVENSEQS